MSDNPFEIDESFESSETFNPATPDEDTELRTLGRALEFAQGFSLLFACCNRHDQRKRLVAELRKHVPKFDVEEIHFEASIDHLLDELRNRLTEPSSDAVFVSGLEYSLPTAADAHTTPLVGNLNAARNSFSLFVPCPLVLWVPEYVLTAIMRGAPDFFSVRSGVYYFAATSQETAVFAEDSAAGDEWQAVNLPLEEKLERIDTIKRLLADYRALPPAQHERRAEVRLLQQLGNLYCALGRWIDAEAVLQQSLEIACEVGDHAGDGQTLYNLGVIYRRQERWAEAKVALEESLEIAKNSGDSVGEGRILSYLGRFYQLQRHWAEAGDALQQSLRIARKIGDSVGEGRTLSYLGRLYQHQGHWVEAEAVSKEGLAILRELGDRANESKPLNYLGNVYHHQGRWAEAAESYRQSLAIRRELGDRVGEGHTLQDLAFLQAAQGNIAEALTFERQAVSVLETTEDKAALKKARSFVAEWEAQMDSKA